MWPLAVAFLAGLLVAAALDCVGLYLWLHWCDRAEVCESEAQAVEKAKSN